MINLAHLRAFHAVAEAGSFTAAARQLQISQPTLSEQVRALENRYQVMLFDRSGRTARLTRLGRDLYEVTGRLARAEAAAERLLSDSAELRSGELRIAADAPVHAMPLFAELERRHPGLRVSLSSGNSEKVMADLLEHEADVAITADPGSHPGICAEPLMRNDLVAVVPSDHRFADRDAITGEELVGERLILREPQSMTRRRLAQALAAVHLEPADVVTVDSREAVHVAVREGLGVGVSAVREVPDDPRIVAVQVSGIDLSLTQYLACARDLRERQPIRTVFEIAHRVIGDPRSTAPTSQSA
ncbi:LysR family transcriptional regulator [Microlunatus elymi]|uniref:LysR family transcriptional regulator n=1 Tax=Microlunatus elymi TaxID=2596828 RepID=A0A516PWD1_9ACTN|nr:LysR substrate-binding domain-containing protein [Microlunatus elymi]QDP95487.1 LysR family transcriptional regulator [Microlunatus elymi]